METTAPSPIVECDMVKCSLEGCVGHVMNKQTQRIAHVMSVRMYPTSHGYYYEYSERPVVHYMVNRSDGQRSVVLPDHEPVRTMEPCRVAILFLSGCDTGLLQWQATYHIVAVEIAGAWLPNLDVRPNHTANVKVVF
jgi:hypothetical protein